MKLPNQYQEVEVKTLNNHVVGCGLVNTRDSQEFLFLFVDKVIIYSKNEVKENYCLFNPADGFKYDLDKLLSK